MTEHDKGYQVLPFPVARQIVVDSGRLASRRHIVHGLLEIDVTQPRQFIRQHKADTGEALSFTAFLAACLAQAIAANPQVQGYRNWRNQLIVFNDVDVVVMIETERGGVALPHVIRAAQCKSVYDIHHEIRAVQTAPKTSPQTNRLTQIGPYLPAFVRDVFYRILLMNPPQFKKIGGTVVVTAVGMFGHGGGWGIGFLPMHTLGLTIGGIGEKPALVDGQLVLHEYLNATVSFDHDVVDGAPAARFVQHFKDLVECGYGLCSAER